MKKYLFPALALGLVMTSCQSDEPFAPTEGGEKQVTFTLNVPGELGTRAGATDNSSDKGGFSNGQGTLYYTLVLDANGDTRVFKDATVSNDGRTATFTPTVVLGRDYTITAYASFDDNSSIDEINDIRTISVSKKFNDESKDAYFQTTTHNFAEGDLQPLELKRPFGKLRLVATDYKATGNGNTAIKSVKVKYNNNVFTTFNAVSGEFSNGQSYEHTLDGTNYSTSYYAPEKDENGNVTGQTIFADYVPVNSTGVAPFEITIVYVDGDEEYTRKFNQDIPVRRNALTTLKGAFFTANSEIKVEVKDAFEGQIPGNDEEQLIIAAAMGGAYTLQGNIELSKPLNITTNMTLNLNGNTLTATNEKGDGAVIEVAEGVSAKLVGGTIKNMKNNGDAAINNAGELVLENITIEGAPLADGGYSAYAVISSGKLTIGEDVNVSADRGCLKLSGAGETIINGGNFTNNDIGSRSLTSHVVDVEDGGSHQLTINGGTFKHLHATTSGGVVICNRTTGTVYVNGGNFRGGNYYGNNNLSDYGYGGTFVVTGGTYDANPANNYIATGYKVLSADGLYYVLPEAIADAASTANVTSVTESTADFATAITTDNGEGTLFMWNDVAYIAEYGEVNIVASEEGKTTVRGIVEYSTALKSATVAEGIEVVGNRTFRKCGELTTVALPNTLTEIGPAVFQSCSKLANVTIPATVKTIGEGAFAECVALTSINIPNGITRLENDVLRNTGLTSIEIPASVTYIGTYAFRDCESLTEVTILSPEFTIENNTFTNMAAPVPTMTIKVVNAEMKAYLESVLTNYDKSYITVVVM